VRQFASAVTPDEQITTPGQVFWHLFAMSGGRGTRMPSMPLPCSDHSSSTKSISLNKLLTVRLLFFALPAALACHIDDAKLSSANLNLLDCQKLPNISATSVLEATSGNLSFKLSFHIAKGDLSAG
jgi:hypothetical protein